MLSFGYVLRRVLQMVPTLLFILVATFALVRFLPGDPLSAVAGDYVTDADVARARAASGLDQPIPTQFLLYARRVAVGDLGRSAIVQEPVVRLVAERLPATLLLSAMAVAIGVGLAVPLAFLSALRRGRAADLAIRAGAQVGLSMPVFYVGLALLTVFAAGLHWFPVGGYGNTWPERAYHLFLPALTLGASLAAVVMRSLRAAIVEVLGAEYVDFARAKGLAARVILGRHVLRNAAISTLALLGPTVGQLLGGAVITETVFAVPGVGRLMIDSIYGRDYPVIQGLTLALAVTVSLVFLATDILQAALDPRIAR